MKQYDFILFDYNGTLIDDVEMNIEIENRLLKRRNPHAFMTREMYLDFFDFPIKDFYEKAGFDFTVESYDDVCDEYKREYETALKDAKLFDDVVPSLKRLRQNGKRLVIISAAERESLVSQTVEFGIDEYFESIFGADNLHGKSKVDTALAWLKSESADPNRVILLGDTTHDAETARQIGCECFLISRGHNSTERLLKTGCEVFGSIEETMERLLK